ncbi:MAG TPA: ABC transporter permease [Alphaproteobacteria bacterium]|nr:ABC transporter permease [Alphaproteobacteria bacterium]
MATLTEAASASARFARRLRLPRLDAPQVSTRALGVAAASTIAFLYLPIVVLIVFSFNDNPVTTLPLRGFTWRWYESAFANADLLRALWNSIHVASSATVLCIVIGVPAAIALDRIEFSGKALFRRAVLLPLVLPGIITGISMLNLFRVIGFDLSLTTVIVGHGTALVSVVITQVFARLQRFNRRLEEASDDLGATPLQTFWLVTLPSIRTAIVGSALLAFTLSFDEIPVTFFLTGRDNTLPMYIYSTLRSGITPEINAIGTIIVVTSLFIIFLSVYLLSDKQEGR